jgi:hypothetical protein
MKSVDGRKEGTEVGTSEESENEQGKHVRSQDHDCGRSS